MRKLTTEQWIEKARKVHGDKYDYLKLNMIIQKKIIKNQQKIYKI